ncbi:universal stress protein [Arthrobacter sp. AOP36-A1-22]|uniref:universal stress protein n=1 Tax=Arthrobacter sp. AOP36-A1-22 TaxID=3457684 RepID=UPI00403400E7
MNEIMATKPVVVGVDGSDDSKAALKWAVEYGQRYEAPVEALAVWDIPTSYGYLAAYAESGEKIEARARELLEETVAEAVGADSNVIRRTERGHPSSTLVEASKDAQLLVLGTRGHGAFAGMLLGSVSQHCVAHSKSPFVVVPSEKEDRKKRK